METNGGTAQAAVEQGGQVASTAAQGASEVVSAVAEQVGEVKSEVAAQARNLIDESKTQLQSQAQSQTEKIADSLRRIGDELTALAEGRVEEASTVVDYARQAAGTVQRYAGEIEQRGFDGVINDVQRFARRRPGTFLLGALAAGFGIGRLLRNAGGDQSAQQFSLPPSPPQQLGTPPLPQGQALPPSIPDATLAGMTSSDDAVVPPSVAAARTAGLSGSDT